MDTLSKEVLLAYKYLEVETITKDFVLIESTKSRGRVFNFFFITFAGLILTYGLCTYYEMELFELIFWMIGIISSYFVFKYKAKLFLKRIKFDKVIGNVVYESFLKKKKEFDFSEIQMRKKDFTKVGRLSSYEATFFYFEDKDSKQYVIGEIFRDQNKDFDFINFIKSFMKKDSNGLNVIPYQRKNDLEISEATTL